MNFVLCRCTQTYICKTLHFSNMLSVWRTCYQQWQGSRRADEGMNVKPVLLLSASVKHVVLLYIHCILMWLCKFSFIPHSCWLPDNLFLSMDSSLTEILVICYCMITCYGMSFIYNTHTVLEVRLPQTFTSPIPIITIGTECRVVLVVVITWDSLRNIPCKRGQCD